MTIEAWLAQAALAYPYLGRGFAALRPTLKPGLDTLAVDSSWRLYWSPEGLARLVRDGGQPHECLRHELEHLLRDHAGRRGSRDCTAWNQAADCEINDDLERVALPSWACWPAIAGRLAEEYYSDPDTAGDCCGGGSGAGAPAEWELPADGAAEASEQIRDAVAADLQAAAGRGEVPQALLLWADLRLRRPRKISIPKIARELARELTRGREDYTYARPSRRQDGAIILPAPIRPARRLAVVVDTSGSMAGHAEFVAAALAAVARSSEAQIVACDAEVHSVRRLRSWHDIRALAGGGGTDMRVGVGAALGLGYSSLLLLTDGETPWPDPWPRGLVALLPTGVTRQW